MKTGGASTSGWNPGNDRRNSYPPPTHVTAYGQSRFSSPGPWPRQRPSYYSNTPGGYNPYQRDAQQRQSSGGRHHGGQSQHGGYSGHSQDSGYGNRDGQYGNRDGQYGNRSSSYGNRDSSYGSRDSPYGNRDSPYGNRDSPYGRDGGSGPNDPRRRSTGVSFCFYHIKYF